MAAFAELAARYDLRIVDDAAQAHGARWAGQRVGGLADATAWSFYPVKNLGALGDGGAVTTNSEAVAARVDRLRNYGSVAKYANTERGYNTRLDEMQAAILRAKLPVLDEWNARRAAIATRYLDALASTALVLPVVVSPAESVWHLFVVRSDDRDALADALAGRGVGTAVHYPIPPHLQGAYADREWGEGAFPVSERMHATVLSLPMSPHLSEAEVGFVVDALVDLTGR
jgi:dTDP-4-amino-4,6-dideoxygalactose transaminase